MSQVCTSAPFLYRHTQRGVALLITLWALALLSLIMGAIVMSVRLENRQSSHLLQSVRSQLAAEAGLAMAIQNMSSPPQGQYWLADSRPYQLEFDDTRVTIRIVSELGKIDLNNSPPELLARLALAVGASAKQAKQVATALKAKQEKDNSAPFQTLDEAALLNGMDNALFIRLEPYITVWSGYDQPIASFADPLVRDVMDQKSRDPVEGTDPGQVLTILSQAERSNGARFTLSATVQLNPMDDSTHPYSVLRWQE
ncbi:type II secretion system minor pseudopilin [Phytohalomonas tamaricis]|uniref:general secretion pathway protein GspK n=1 Tax=Phytohalomonas tamaricis TaxID=2081032 RepID=UPI001319F717|nr:type II secretion system protein GspK [Phytohalomonas tamaricis]